MKTIVFVAVSSLFMSILPAFAQGIDEENYTAETMMKLCKGEVSDVPPEVQSYICTFRIQGVVNTMAMNCLVRDQGYTTPDELSTKPPTSKGPLRQTFINYMKDHPEVWEYHWANALSLAVSDKFPCDK